MNNLNIKIGTGSACSNNIRNTSHVLDAILKSPEEDHLTKSVLRISLGDNNSLAQVNKFVNEFTKVLLYIYENKLT